MAETSGYDFTLRVGFLGDFKDVIEKVKILDENVKTNPIELSTQLPNVDTTKAQEWVKGLQSQGIEIEGLTFKIREMRTASGETYRELVQGTATWQDANNNVIQSVKTLNNDIASVQKNSKSYDAMASKATEWYNRSMNMEGKEKQAIQSTAAELIKKINLYNQLASGGQIKEARLLEPEIQKMNVTLEKNISLSQRAANVVRSWADNLVNAIKQTVSYSISLGLVRAAQQQLNEAIQFSIDLNKEMVNIQILQAEGAQTDEQIKSLASSYNKLAQELGSTTLEVAKGSVEWLRQGKTIQETTELLKASTMLSKLGNLSAAEATEYLTSTINSYKMSTEEAVSVVDRLVQVDNNSATSTRELATALRYSAATAAESGVSLNELISYIGVMSSTTRINAESIGQSLKTIFARMQDIKAGKIDEDGLGINNVESALARVDIKLRDSDTSFRNFGDVLQDLSGKWNTLNDIEQANIAKAIAGVRQQNLFSVLMQNMNQALELQTLQTNSAGLAMDRYNIYLQSVEASQNKLKAAAEALYMSLDFQKIIKGVLDLGTSILGLIEKLGGLRTVIISVAASFALLNLSKITSGIVSMAGAVKTLQAALALLKEGNSIAAIVGVGGFTAPQIAIIVATIAAIGGIVYALSTLITTAKEAQKAYEDATQKLNESVQAYKSAADAISSMKDLQEEYVTLSEKINKTSEEQQRFIELQNEIYNLSGKNISGTFDADLNFRIKDNDAIKESIALLEKQLELKARIAAQDARDAAIAGQKVYENNLKEIKNLQSQIDIWNSELSTATAMNNQKWANSLIKKIEDTQTKLQEKMLDTSAFEAQVATTYEQIYAVLGKQSAEAFKSSFDEGMQTSITNKHLELLGQQMNDYYSRFLPDAEKANQIQADFSATLETVAKNLDTVTKAMEQQTQDGYLNSDSINAIVNAGLGNYLVETANGWWFNRDAVIDNTEALIESALSDAKLIDVLEAVRQKRYEDAIVLLAHKAAQDADKNATDINIQAVISQIQTLQKLTSAYSGVSRSAGGAAKATDDFTKSQKDAYEAEIKGYQNQIKSLETQKKALEDQKKAYKDIINAKKESLKADKEAAEYANTLEDKNKELSDIENELFALQFDNSEEANKKRIELEQQKADKIEEINKLQTDHTYDQTVNALDAQEKAFEDMINKQIAAIDTMIDKIKEMIDSINEAITALNNMNKTQSSGGGTGNKPVSTTPTTPLPVATKAQETKIEKYDKYGAGRLQQYYHYGGIVESHHDGDFAGNLKTNEVFSKLLKGEYVATENQMSNFLRNVLPRFAYPNLASSPIAKSSMGDEIKVDIKISVEGNFDKEKNIPDIKKAVFEALNDASRQKGKKSNTFTHSI
jgi:TP901 family phage tail tape measure protein